MPFNQPPLPFDGPPGEDPPPGVDGAGTPTKRPGRHTPRRRHSTGSAPDRNPTRPASGEVKQHEECDGWPDGALAGFVRALVAEAEGVARVAAANEDALRACSSVGLAELYRTLPAGSDYARIIRNALASRDSDGTA